MGWTSVKESLPDERVADCLVFNGDAPHTGQYVFCATYFAQARKFISEHKYEGNITHWRIKPNPPDITTKE